MQITYKDKTVLVVGGTSGIGAGIVGAFAGSGASVIATGATEAEVRAARGNALFHVLDVRDNAAVKSYVAGLSRVDVVVNCESFRSTSGPRAAMAHRSMPLPIPGARVLTIGVICTAGTR